MAMLKTPETFFEEYNGKRIDDDGAYGVQCVDGFRRGCKYLGIPVLATPNDWADGYWTCLNADGTPSQKTADWQEKYFDKIRDPKQFKDGDWVIWPRGSVSHPSSHVAMYYKGQQFGERQYEDARQFCLKPTDFSDALGALRPKAWGRISEFESDLTINGHLYHLYGQADGLTTAVLSPGLNKVAMIQDLDCDYWVYAKITGCNLYQMNKDNPDGQPYGMTFGDISSPISKVYQNLPGQDSTMFFDLETGEHDDCTGVTISPEHNVFSPTLIYQRGKNVQYARVMGLSLCTHVSMYAFVIRYTDGKYCLGITNEKMTPNQINEDLMSVVDVDSISIIDGGDSAQMMRYIMKEHRVEYTRTTPRPTAGCIALIGKKIESTPDQTPHSEDPEATQDEEKKDEEQDMSEVKPQEQPEMSPVEGWTDPEPKTNIIAERIAALLSVKSILTLSLTIIFGYLVVNQIAIPDLFNEIYKIVILFFFGYQTGKAAGK